MRQKLGQHFLIDQTVTETMVNTLKLDQRILVIEIGPGQGVLTNALLAAGHAVLAIEWDEALSKRLQLDLSDQSDLLVLHADIRKLNLVAKVKELGFKRYIIAANLPYYLSSFFLRQVFQYELLPEMMVLLLQKEVAMRLVANPGESNRSVISVMTQIYSTPEIIRFVPSLAFNPPPQVESAVVKFDHIHNPFGSKDEEKHFFRVVKAGFGEKRKIIANSLAGGLNLEREAVIERIKSVGLNPNSRAEDLSVDDWRALTNVL